MAERYRPLVCPEGCPTRDQIRRSICPDDPHCPRTSLVCLENTHNMRGGVVISADRIREVSEVCQEYGLSLHLDGARLFNAAAALRVSVSELTRDVDSVMISLSKGLSCPIGSIYAASADRVASARRTRKLLGGGMRQAGILAACAGVALEAPYDALREDHTRAERLAAGLTEIDGLKIPPPQTNIVLVEFESGPGPRVQAWLDAAARGGVGGINISNQRLRLVTHRGIDNAAIDHAIEVFRRVAKELD